MMVNDACGIMYSFVKSRCFTNKVHTLSTVLLTCTARVPSTYNLWELHELQANFTHVIVAIEKVSKIVFTLMIIVSTL